MRSLSVDRTSHLEGGRGRGANSSERRVLVWLVPELPGCAADGPTYQDAVANVEVVIGEWIETAKELGRPIPKARGRLMFA